MEARMAMAHHTVCRAISPMLAQGMIQQVVHWMVCPDPEQHMEKTKSHTVPVQFQYSAHSTRDRNSF